MPETLTTNNARAGGSVVVQRFYEAVGRGDSDTLGEIVAEQFAADAALVLPPSLPYGGSHQGARRLGTMFAGMATAPGGPKNLELTDVIDDGDKVAARIAFEWVAPGASDGIPHEAVEFWSFSEGKVTEIRGFYWDTHACAEQVSASKARDDTHA